VLLSSARHVRCKHVGAVAATAHCGTAFVAALLLGGCPMSVGGPPLDDAGDLGARDAGDGGGADAGDPGPRDLGVDASCIGVAEGTYVCDAYAHVCCHGTWDVGTDGPCWRPDAAMHDCVLAPEFPGCPCAPDGPGTCSTGGARIDCVGGVWTWNTTFACCAP
jgi:hypothetical protein